jgi:hypothetical protein
MKLLTASFFAILALSSAALAQSAPNGTPIGKMTVSTDILYQGGTGTLNQTSRPRRVISEIIVFVTSGGGIDYSINSSTIRFDGDGYDPSTLDVYNDLAKATVMQGVQMGYTPCSSSCTGDIVARVWAESCIVRTGTGTDTRFTPLNSTSYSTRFMSACGSTSSPTVTQVRLVDPGCGNTIQ